MNRICGRRTAQYEIGTLRSTTRQLDDAAFKIKAFLMKNKENE